MILYPQKSARGRSITKLDRSAHFMQITRSASRRSGSSRLARTSAGARSARSPPEPEEIAHAPAAVRAAAGERVQSPRAVALAEEHAGAHAAPREFFDPRLELAHQVLVPPHVSRQHHLFNQS